MNRRLVWLSKNYTFWWPNDFIMTSKYHIMHFDIDYNIQFCIMINTHKAQTSTSAT